MHLTLGNPFNSHPDGGLDLRSPPPPPLRYSEKNRVRATVFLQTLSGILSVYTLKHLSAAHLSSVDQAKRP